MTEKSRTMKKTSFEVSKTVRKHAFLPQKLPPKALNQFYLQINLSTCIPSIHFTFPHSLHLFNSNWKFFAAIFTIAKAGFNWNIRRYTWASRNVIKPKHNKTNNMQFRYLSWVRAQQIQRARSFIENFEWFSSAVLFHQYSKLFFCMQKHWNTGLVLSFVRTQLTNFNFKLFKCWNFTLSMMENCFYRHTLLWSKCKWREPNGKVFGGI